jgi:hypothetical protein
MDIVGALTGTTAQVVYFIFCVVAPIARIRRSVVTGREAPASRRNENEGKQEGNSVETTRNGYSYPRCPQYSR